MTAFTEEQVSALRTVDRLWAGRQFVLIGASALACFMEVGWRATQDLDLLLVASLDNYPAGLDQIPGWRRDALLEHRWLSPEGVRLDVIPAGDRLLAQGELVWSESAFRMSLVGVRLALEENLAVAVSNELTVQVAPVPVVALLKVAAFLDRPNERQRDLEDLTHILDKYPNSRDERRFSDEVFELGLSYEEAGPFVLGHQLGSLANEEETELLHRFISQVHRNVELQARMARLGPARWQGRPDEIVTRIAAFEKGIGSARGDRHP